MALNDRLVAFAQAVGVDIGELIITRGNLTTLNTVAKNNLVAAINEIKAGIASIDLTALINDAATTGDLTSVYSADKLVALFDQLKNEILNDAPDSFNTLKEISDYLAANDQNINNLLDLINKTVRYDATQALTTGEQLQACVNINVGNPEIDLVAILNAELPTAGSTWIITSPNGLITLKIDGAFAHNVPVNNPDPMMDFQYYLDTVPGGTFTVTLIDNQYAGDITLSDYWIYDLQDTGTLAAIDQAGTPMVLNTPYTVIVGAAVVPGTTFASIGFNMGIDAVYLRPRVL